MNKHHFAPVVQVRFDGNSRHLNVVQLGLPANATDCAIKHAVARDLAVSILELRFHVVERAPNGNITVRPDAALASS